MIEGFEDFTAPLSEKERELVRPLVLGLKTKIGKAMAITNREIQARMKEKGYSITGARVRKIINHIRWNDLVPNLIASSRGYYVSNDAKELKMYKESLKKRGESIIALAEKYKIITTAKQERLNF